MKAFTFTAALAAAAAGPAWADFERVKSPHDVATTIDRLEEAVAEAGATVFARVDHAEGARGAGLELAPAELLIFGNPALGTPAMQDDIRAGLALPLRMLAYQDAEGQTWLFWEEAEEIFDDLKIDDDAPYVEKIEGALEKLADEATDD
ncbi:DUF302 domain-containing protein [Roseivivax sp. CAU 1761]